MPAEPQAQTRCGGSGEVLAGEVVGRGTRVWKPCPGCPDCKQKQVGDGARKRWPDGFAPFSPLSQDEITEAAEAAIADRLNEVYMQPKDSAAVWAEAALLLQERLDAARQQWQEELLSDEDREQLGALADRIANDIEEEWPHAEEMRRHVRLLRNLATKGGEGRG